MRDSQFRTTDGTAVPAVTADEMREVDRLAVEVFGIDLFQMMENAGRNLAWHARDIAEDATIVAGNGGNGGGGLVAARHLANRDVAVRVVLDREPSALEGAAAHQLGILSEMDVPIETGPDALAEPGLIVDALIGYGLEGAIRGTAAELVQAMNSVSSPILSLDVPSGRNATTGNEPDPAVDPARVVTLALPKTGLEDLGCPLYLADISLPEQLYERMDMAYENPFDDTYWVAMKSTDPDS